MPPRPEIQHYPIQHGEIRPLGQKIDMGVVHSMAEWIIGDDGRRWWGPAFHRELAGVGAHGYLNPNGVVIRSAAPDFKAWHARGFNRRSVGCEFLVQGEYGYAEFIKTILDGADDYTESQYSSGGWWYAIGWRENFEQMYPPLTWSQLKPHSDLSPRRKFDPGQGFDWDRFEFYFRQYGGES